LLKLLTGRKVILNINQKAQVKDRTFTYFSFVKSMGTNMKILKQISFLACAATTAAVFTAAPAQAQSDPLMGQISYFGFNFCPRGWMEANGALLPISSFTALFSLYGTTYGGDGRTSFGLPDLRGRAAINYGTGPGLTPVTWGEKGGAENFTLTETTMPSHNHMVNTTNEIANKNGPGTDFLSVPTDRELNIYHEGPSDPSRARQMDPAMISHTGGGASVSKVSPFLGVKACIASEGVYPSRS
jgi:microcystin-dependent protein